MSYELDHLFIFCSPDAPEAEHLIKQGFTEGQPNIHPGQGTRCRRFFFHNSYLEFLWIYDEKEARGYPAESMALFERSLHKNSGYSPFGIALRHKSDFDEKKSPPFKTWSYTPSYLPAGLSISFADSVNNQAEPLIFILPMGIGSRPDEYPSELKQPLIHKCGAGCITGIRITLASSIKSENVLTLEQAGLADFTLGEEPLAEIMIDGGLRRSVLDCRPCLPLVIRY